MEPVGKCFDRPLAFDTGILHVESACHVELALTTDRDSVINSVELS